MAELPDDVYHQVFSYVAPSTLVNCRLLDRQVGAIATYYAFKHSEQIPESSSTVSAVSYMLPMFLCYNIRVLRQILSTLKRPGRMRSSATTDSRHCSEISRGI